MFRLVVLASLLLACRGPNPGSGGAADAASPDAQGPDARPPRPHEPPTAAGIAYFADIDSQLNEQDLVLALHGKLRADHIETSFDGLYEAYATTDTGREGCAGIFDFYSSKCWDAAEACGNYTQEGDCFNREHSWPKSWWGGGTGPEQHQDLFAVIPADGYVNNSRGQLPLGQVPNASYTSSNQSRRGLCTTPGVGSGEQCFEPPDSLKGDFARIYFYMAVRYEGELVCCDEVAVSGADIKAWQEDVLRQWHAVDPVDTWEQERNEQVFALQKNRNPFVDYPGFVDRISDF